MREPESCWFRIELAASREKKFRGVIMTNSIKYRLDKPVTLGVREITVTEGDIYIFDSKEDNKTKDVRE